MFFQSVSTKTGNQSSPYWEVGFQVKGEYWNLSGCRSHKNGASWAYELGQDSNSCPLSVEDLDQPGQILVEVPRQAFCSFLACLPNQSHHSVFFPAVLQIQCENYELFLDIAQVIRRLKLTILKGILETRLNKPWAHFIVEVKAKLFMSKTTPSSYLFVSWQMIWNMVVLSRHPRDFTGWKYYGR